MDHPPLKGAKLAAGTLALSLASFMTVLDSSIANVSLSAIAGDLGVSPSQGTWVITSFGVANAISVPLIGWLTKRFGQVRLMVVLILLFVTASWLCGLAPNLESLLVFRVVQGAVCGPMVPLAQTLLLSSYPVTRYGSAMAMSSITVMVAPVIGPILGGWVTDNLSWPWIFFINLPIGLFCAMTIWSVYRDREVERERLRIDKVGLVLLVLWVGAFQLMVDLGKEYDWFEATEIVALAVFAVVALVLFLIWELTETHPIVDLRLFTDRNFGLGVVVLSAGYGLFFGNAVLMPLWLQQHMGYTAVWAGAAVAPVGLLSILLTPWVGRHVSSFDPRVLISIGLLCYACAFWLRSRFNLDTDVFTIMLPALVQGAATAFFFIPLQVAMYHRLGGRSASAAGLAGFMRLISGALCASVSVALWQSRAADHREQLIEHVSTDNPTRLAWQRALRDAALSGDQQMAILNRMIDQQAFTLAATDIFSVTSMLFLLLGLVVWRTSAPPRHVASRSIEVSAPAD